MKRLLLAFAIFASALAAGQSAPHDIDLAASDGTHLKATFYPASTNGKSAPAVMLLHMCNTDRKSWTPVAEQLAETGISALTIDNRGLGESGPRIQDATPEVQQQVRDKWPGDFDTAFNWLLSQPGVDKNRIGAGGGSCGVNNVVKLASRHREICSLVLLAGGTDSAGVNYLRQNAWIPLFTSAAADDEYSSETPQLMQWLPRSREIPAIGSSASKMDGTEPRSSDRIPNCLSRSSLSMSTHLKSIQQAQMLNLRPKRRRLRSSGRPHPNPAAPPEPHRFSTMCANAILMHWCFRNRC